MKEYDPENGTYQNVEVDPETKEVHYGELNPDEDKIVYKFKKIKHLHLFSKWWFWVICAVIVIVPWMVVLVIHHHDSQTQKLDKKEVKEVVKETMNEVNPEKIDNTLTIIDSSAKGDAYTEIIDTVVNEHTLRIYKVYYGIPELFIGDIDPEDTNIVMAARAADVGTRNEIIGLFIYKGENWGTGSKHKEGFCAVINNEIALGIDTVTPLVEDAISQKGSFFRNAPLVNSGIACAYEGDHDQKTTRRALCNFNNEIVFITCDNITMTEFSMSLADLGVKTAIYMVGAKGGYGFCRDKAGKLSTWGVNRFNIYPNVNYLIWKKK